MKTSQNIINKVLEEKLEEWLFNYHIRGCQLANKESNKVCDENKEQFKSFFSSALKSVMEEAVKEVVLEKKKSASSLPNTPNKKIWQAHLLFIEHFNQAISEMEEKSKRFFKEKKEV